MDLVKLVASFLVISTFFTDNSAYPQGAPPSTCLTMFPKHHHRERQETPCPFNLLVSSTSYVPGQNITVTISGDPGKTLRGFQIRAHRVKGDTEIVQGTFVSYPSTLLKPFSCFGGKDNMLTHNSNEDKTSLTLIWKAPDTPVGDIVFTATIVTTFLEFWIDQQSAILVDRSGSNNLGSLEKVLNVDPKIELNEGCGETKGCLLFPRHCSGQDCEAAVSYRTVGDYVQFEMLGKAEGWVSVGFSDDILMGKEETLSCTAQDSRVTVQRGYNPALYNERQYTVGIINMTTVQKDGVVYCRFARPKVMSLVSVSYKPDDPLNPTIANLTFDLNQDWYIFLGWGYTYNDTDVMGKHDELPVVSESKVSFSTYITHRGSVLNVAVQIHGCLMIIAWMLFVGLGTVIARHYRGGFGARTICGQKRWFQFHRFLVGTAACCTAASFILIFVHIGGWSKLSGVHTYIGIGVMAATVLQVFIGLIRPSPTAQIRPVFNWIHRIFGKLTHIASAVEIFFAFDIPALPSTMRKFGLIVCIIWVVAQVIWEIILEIMSFCKSLSSSKNDYEVSNQFKLEEKYPEETSGVANVILVLYILTIAAITVAGLCVILLY